MDETTRALARELGDALTAGGLEVTTAESCTGGLIAAAITSVPGSSGWFREGYVTYANEAKSKLVGVPDATLAVHGAVSAETVESMALGALRRSGADLAVAVSGIAGPGGAVPGKPVGTVWLAVAVGGRGNASEPAVRAALHRFEGDRDAVRAAAVVEGLRATISAIP